MLRGGADSEVVGGVEGGGDSDVYKAVSYASYNAKNLPPQCLI